MNHIAKLWLYQNEMKWPQEVADTCNQVGGYINETSLFYRLHTWISPPTCTPTLLIFNNYMKSRNDSVCQRPMDGSSQVKSMSVIASQSMIDECF